MTSECDGHELGVLAGGDDALGVTSCPRPPRWISFPPSRAPPPPSSTATTRTRSPEPSATDSRPSMAGCSQPVSPPLPRVLHSRNYLSPPTSPRPHRFRALLPTHPLLPSPSPQPEVLSSAAFQVTLPQDLPELLSQSGTLLIDIRPPSAFDARRIVSSTSLSVPSTLLKRPLFTLDKLAAMIPSKRAMAEFLKWPSANHIIVIDADSCALTPGSNLLGILRKFRTESFRGRLSWLKGGFHAVQRATASNPLLLEFITTSPQVTDDSIDRDPSLPRSRDLPHSAFEQSSTTIASQRTCSTDASTQSAAPGPSSTRMVAANPFYDNIRQLSELSDGITERIPLILHHDTVSRIPELPFPWLREIASRGAAESAETLAMQFYKIELAEQRRLVGIMEEHSRQSHLGISTLADFPFSITAGLEKGSKNRYGFTLGRNFLFSLLVGRYQNIWPFEHARVRLSGNGIDGSDYVNASFVQPPATRKRYIATQGPMPDTFSDFWRCAISAP